MIRWVWRRLVCTHPSWEPTSPGWIQCHACGKTTRY